MQFIPTDDYREVSMYAGLNAIQIGNAEIGRASCRERV